MEATTREICPVPHASKYLHYLPTMAPDKTRAYLKGQMIRGLSRY